VDLGSLDYPLEGHHLAAVVSGADAESAAADMAARLDRRLLMGESAGGRSAVWFGGARSFDRETLEAMTVEVAEGSLRMALGEPGEGVAGWRRSRRQAEAAHLVAERGGRAVLRYRDVALLAAALRDPDLSHFLAESYVEPLGGEHSPLADTLRGFLELDGNASSTAASLGVTRQTVSSRLRAVEERIGGPIGSHSAQIETALRLAELAAEPQGGPAGTSQVD
jgi:DNA-binding PucR family transcriptional regulator